MMCDACHQGRLSHTIALVITQNRASFIIVSNAFILLRRTMRECCFEAAKVSRISKRKQPSRKYVLIGAFNGAVREYVRKRL